MTSRDENSINWLPAHLDPTGPCPPRLKELFSISPTRTHFSLRPTLALVATNRGIPPPLDSAYFSSLLSLIVSASRRRKRHSFFLFPPPPLSTTKHGSRSRHRARRRKRTWAGAFAFLARNGWMDGWHLVFNGWARAAYIHYTHDIHLQWWLRRGTPDGCLVGKRRRQRRYRVGRGGRQGGWMDTTHGPLGFLMIICGFGWSWEG